MDGLKTMTAREFELSPSILIPGETFPPLQVFAGGNSMKSKLTLSFSVKIPLYGKDNVSAP